MTISREDKFEVYVLKRIPYLTRILGIVAILVFEFYGLAPLMPSKNHSQEIGVLYFMTIYPDKLKAVFFLGIPTAVFVLFLYIKVRPKREAVLTFDTDKIELRGKGWSKAFPTNRIRYFNCYDPYTEDGFPEEKFTLEIRNWNGKGSLVNLKDYSQANRLVDILTVYDEVKLEVRTDTASVGLSNDEI